MGRRRRGPRKVKTGVAGPIGTRTGPGDRAGGIPGRGKNKISWTKTAPRRVIVIRKEGVMDIKMTCPSCNQHISAEPAMRGKVIRCPSCDASVKVPEKSQIAHRPAAGAGKIVLGLLVIGAVVMAT